MDLTTEPLTDAQIRVLGVLVEKQLTTPAAYPLTENALIAGCNQSTNRDPVVEYDPSVVRPALIRLRERALARQVRRAGERAEKHAHRLDERLELPSTAPLAVLTVLMLRGPQTPGELRSRTQRLHPLSDADSLDTALAELERRGLVEPLPRRPGEKQVRWRHLLASVEAPTDRPGPHDPPTGASPVADHTARDGARAAPHHPHEDGPGADPGHPPASTVRELASAVERLERRVATLEGELGLGSTDDTNGRHP